MKRCTILVLYDVDGDFDETVFYLIKQLRSVSTIIIVVINGIVQSHCKERLKDVCDVVTQRENVGYDAGAYAHVFGNEEWQCLIKSCDEIVFCNDTFFGPLRTFIEIFETMSQKKCDFWGFAHVEEWFEDYIHSFFMVFRRKILENKALETFFSSQSIKDIKSYADASFVFERGLFGCLKKEGYTYKTLMGRQEYNIFRESNVNIQLDFPFMKKKVFLARNYDYEVVMDALAQINKSSSYDVEMILDVAKRKFQTTIEKQAITGYSLEKNAFRFPPKERMISKKATEDFINERKKIYLYGVEGCLERTIRQNANLKKLAGFIVSPGYKTKDSYMGYPLYEVTEFQDEDNAGIIVTLFNQNSHEIKPYLMRFRHVLFLWEDMN